MYFITREDAEKVLDACPDAQWRLLFALSRYGGLRCPSEHLALKWEHVNFGEDRLKVESPKTEHHAGGGSRVIPMFPELRPHLDQVWEESGPSDVYVVTRYRNTNTNANLRTQLTRIIQRAGLEPWPKLFQNLRSTRETELVRDYSIHVASSWIGNSPKVALSHYTQITESDFQEAAARSAVEGNPKGEAATASKACTARWRPGGSIRQSMTVGTPLRPLRGSLGLTAAPSLPIPPCSRQIHCTDGRLTVGTGCPPDRRRHLFSSGIRSIRTRKNAPGTPLQKHCKIHCTTCTKGPETG